MKLLGQLNQIDRFDSSWTNKELREGATLKQLKSIATVRSVGASTRIEGSKMTNSEVEALIERIEVARLDQREEQEVAGYFEAMDMISTNYHDIEVSEAHIKYLHKILMQFSEKDAWHRGNYKQLSNSVDETLPDGSRRTIFRTSEPGFPTEDAMRRLVEWYHRDQETIPVIKIALFVYEFLTIHPFQDGNGRLSRLLATFLLLKNNYSWIQYISFEHEIEYRKAEYYRVLMNTQRQRPGENVTAWIAFFIDCLMKIQNQLDEKIRTKGILDSLTINEQKILSFIENHSGSKSGEISRKLNIPLPTVKKVLQRMISDKFITKTGIGRGTSYSSDFTRLVKENVMFILNKDKQEQHFSLSSPIHSITIKKIILKPLFSWKSPEEWIERIRKQLISFTIGCSTRTDHFYESTFLLAPMVSPFHYQPVFEPDHPILIPDIILEREVYLYELPAEIKISIQSLDEKFDFEFLFVYDAVL